MEYKAKFPFKFFVIAFSWSWSFWLLLVLASIGIVSMEKELLSTLIFPIGILGSFGPAVGAFYCLRTLNGKGAVANYLRGLLDLNFGWRAWLIPIIVFGGIHGWRGYYLNCGECHAWKCYCPPYGCSHRMF